MNSVFLGKTGGGRIARTAVDLFYRRDPTAAGRYPPGAREKCAEDMLMHLLYLEAAASVDGPGLLVDYLAWVRGLLANLGLPAGDLRPSLDCLADAIEADGGALGARQAAMLRRSLDELDRLPPELSSLACSGAPLPGLAERYLSALLASDPRAAGKLVFEAVDGGTTLASIYLEVIAPAMREVGRLWHANRITVAEEHYVSSATQVIMCQLYPRVFSADCKGPVLVATCVEGELHELGMRMVADLFQLAGWDTHFLGANMPPRAVVKLADDVGAAVVAISAMIVPNLPAVASQIALLRAGPAGKEEDPGRRLSLHRRQGLVAPCGGRRHGVRRPSGAGRGLWINRRVYSLRYKSFDRHFSLFR